MPTTDPTQPWLPPYTPTPQPQNWKELLKLIWAIFKDYKKQPVKPGIPLCESCGRALEVIGFDHHEALYGCPRCNSL